MAGNKYVTGWRRVVDKLRAKAARARKDDKASVIVGYDTNYAVYVHENLAVFHSNGQAKFLEQPLRANIDEIYRVVNREMLKGKTLAQALVTAGLFLKSLSQPLVPVDTGRLRRSAFVTLERGG